tara:strand:+ start:1328 stop:1501 length:174 start_codon:yes stop_codon:yes gene_type:complete
MNTDTPVEAQLAATIEWWAESDHLLDEATDKIGQLRALLATARAENAELRRLLSERK